MPLEHVEQLMIDDNSYSYGIRLHEMLVVDCDTDNPETASYVKTHFGDSPFQVKTPRGRHHYFRNSQSNRPQTIRQDNIAIDFKTGPNAYVVGPGSIRVDGGEYFIEVGAIEDLTNLPEFRVKQRSKNFVTSPQHHVPVGERHNKFLKPRAIKLAKTASSLEALVSELREAVNLNCEEPQSVSATEIENMAGWAWQKRLDGELWGGGISVAQIHNHEFETLMEYKNGPDALALLYNLHHCHGANPGKRFAVASKEMASASYFGWTEWRIRKARDTLVSVKLLNRVKRGGGTAGPGLFQIARLQLTK